jgi:hypothetical protein
LSWSNTLASFHNRRQFARKSLIGFAFPLPMARKQGLWPFALPMAFKRRFTAPFITKVAQMRRTDREKIYEDQI